MMYHPFPPLTAYRRQVAGALEAARVVSPTTFEWFGRRSPRLPNRIERAISPQTARDYLRYRLQTQLYTHFYLPGGVPARTLPVEEETGATGPEGYAPFVRGLSKANRGRGYFSQGWARPGESAPGQTEVEVSRGGLTLLAPNGDIVPARDGNEQEQVEVRFPKEAPRISPGFYMALGDADLDDQSRPPGDPIVRFYWHLTASGALRLVALATRMLNHAQIPFKLKVINDPRRFTRCDSAVLYLPRSLYVRAAPLVARIYSSVRSYVHPPVPALTMPLAPGLSMAEDQGDGDSFGMRMCSLLAEAIIRCHEQETAGGAARLRAVEEHFASEGVSIEHPYGVGIAGCALPLDLARQRVRPYPAGTPFSLAAPPPSVAGDSAAEIAARLCEEAIRYDGECNWLGTGSLFEWREGSARATTRREELSALGPDLYAGTAGVGLFLAEYAAATGDRQARRTARAALRHSLRAQDQVRQGAPGSLGLYTGRAGVALAAARAGVALDLPDLVFQAERAALQVAQGGQGAPVTFDYLSGLAGGIVALLAIRPFLQPAHPDRLLDGALGLGEDLLAAARPFGSGGALVWPPSMGLFPLTGLAHGAAGTGLALLALWKASGVAAYRRAAEGAFLYESLLFNPTNANWPDLRDVSLAETGAKRKMQPRAGDASLAWATSARSALPYAQAWCHGAPGISLSRLAAFEMTGEPARLAEAEVGLAATRRALRRALHNPSPDLSLCHGLPGRAAVLHHASLLGHRSEDDASLLDEVAAIWSRQARRRPPPSACRAPGLMLGLAGAGHFFLRLRHPSTPSPLLFTAW